MFKQKINVGSNDVDCFLNLKVSSLFMYFQDVATNAVIDLKLGSEQLRKSNVDWIMTGISTEIYRIPGYHEDIKIITYPGKAKLDMFYPRYFVVEDKKGNVLAKCSSMWALLDQTTRRIVTGKELLKKLPGEEKGNELPLPGKNAFDATKLIDNRKIYFSEIDLNGHLNNCSYVKLVMDSKSKEFYEKYEISKINLSFLKELHEGDNVAIFASGDLDENIVIKRGEDICFTAKVEYKKK